ncbi:MAG TPA: response regulator [Bryobacteraceae bacterium]|jgi:two-component system response regulator|nr:response regulator [Bryobacteraceae bacterium]
MSSNPVQLLLIEDNLGDIMLFRYALDTIGEPYQLHVLQDGEEGLEYINRHWTSPGSEPCLIIIDLHLPKCGGLTIVKKLRESPALAHVKLAVVTTVASPAEEAQLALLKVDLYRRKPAEIEEFLKLAQEILDVCQNEATSVAG